MLLNGIRRARDIHDFSSILGKDVAKGLLESMDGLLAEGSRFAIRGQPVVKLDPAENDLDCPILATAYGHWRSSRAGQALPTVDHIDPEQLRPALGWFALVDVIDGGADFVYRLFGSEIAWRFDLDLTGQSVSAMPSPLGAFVTAAYRACTAAKSPLLIICRFGSPGVGTVGALLLPWTDGTGTVTRLMAVTSLRDPRVHPGVVARSTLTRLSHW